MKIYYYNSSCVIYTNIHNSLRLFMLLLLPFLSSLFACSLNTTYIHQQKKERRRAIHNSIRLISVHRGGQHHTRLYSSSPLCIHICRYVYTIVLFSPFTVPLHMPIYGNTRRSSSYRKTTDIPKYTIVYILIR